MQSKAHFASCETCPLRDGTFVPPNGLVDPDTVIIVGEGPGFEEMRAGKPFAGPSGRLLKETIRMTGNDPDRVYLTNATLCGSTKRLGPEELSLAAQNCHARLLYELEQHPGQTVLSLGKVATESLLNHDGKEVRGQWLKLGNKHVIPTWHPAYVLRNAGEFGTLRQDIVKAFRGPNSRPPAPPKVIWVQELDELRERLSQCPTGETVAFDIETDQVDWYDRPDQPADPILTLSLTWAEDWAIVVDDIVLYDRPDMLAVLQEFFDRTDIEFAGQNASFDMIFLLAQAGLQTHCDFDTMLAHYLLDENSRHGLKELATNYLGYPDYEAEISNYLASANDRYSKIPFPTLAQYNAWDVVATRALKFVFERELKEEGMYEWPFKRILMAVQPVLMRMEMRGLPIDEEYLHYADHEMDLELGRITDDLRDMSGRPSLNPNAPLQLAEVIYDQFKLPKPTSPRIKPRSTSHAALEHLRGKHPFVDTLMRHRRIAKLRSSYVKNMLSFRDTKGFIHPEALQHGTEVGRISMRNPAAQTLPRAAEKDDPKYDPYLDGAIVRGAVVAPPGYKLIEADYSQAELRVAGYLSNETFLIDAFAHGEDLHSKVARAMFGEHFTKEQRVRCKMFNFSYLYGGSEYSFAADAGLPINEARRFVQDYNQVMPHLARFRVDQYKKLQRDGYVKSIFGRRRRFPLLTPQNQDDARKACVHAPVAGTVSDLIMLSMVRLEAEGIELVLTVHDSIFAIAPEDQAEAVGKRLQDVMMQVAQEYVSGVAWKVDVAIKDRWAQPPRFSPNANLVSA